MKYLLTFKTDVLNQIKDEVSSKEFQKIKDVMERFLEYDEYVYLEIDTKEKTVIVVEK